MTIPLSVLQEREISLTGTFRYANTWPTASRSDPRNIKALVQPQL